MYILNVTTFWRFYHAYSKSFQERQFAGGENPGEFQFDTDEVENLRRDDELVLRKKAKSLEQAFNLLASLPVDFLAERKDDLPQERAGL